MLKYTRDIKDIIVFDGRHTDMYSLRECTNKQIIEAAKLEDYHILIDSDIKEEVGGDYFILCLN